MKKVSIFIFFVVVVSIAIGGLLFLSTGNFSFISQDKQATETIKDKIINLNNTNEISIKASSTNIRVITEDRNDMKINLINSKGSISTYTEGGKTYISVSPTSNKNFFFSFEPNTKLEIILPKSYSSKLLVESSSGNISLNNIILSNLFCQASSGNITIKDLTITTFNCSSVSGNINGDTITTIDSSFKSSSGNISLKKFLGNVSTSASSGDIKIDYKEFNNNLTANSSSGNIRLTLPKSSEFNLNAATSSGNINCSFPIEVKDNNNKHNLQGTVKSDKNKIYIRTSSGNVGIND